MALSFYSLVVCFVCTLEEEVVATHINFPVFKKLLWTPVNAAYCVHDLSAQDSKRLRFSIPFVLRSRPVINILKTVTVTPNRIDLRQKSLCGSPSGIW